MATAMPNRPSGTLTANSQGQEATDRMAEATVGPIAKQTATTSALKPTPRPSERDGKMKRISAVLTLMMPLAPKPWNTRAAASVGSDQAAAQTSEASVNSASPAI